MARLSAKSPGFVQAELKRKAENANGSFTKFSTQKTALSQTHLNGERIKSFYQIECIMTLLVL